MTTLKTKLKPFELIKRNVYKRAAEWIDYFFKTWFSDGQNFTGAKSP